jgi:hypothetical protein
LVAVWLATLILGNIITTLLGQPASIVAFIKQHAVLALSIGALLTIITVIALFVPLYEKQLQIAQQSAPGHRPRTHRSLLSPILSTILPIMSLSLFFILLATILLRPPGCPGFICPAPQVVTNPQGSHDLNLEVYPTAIQSAYYALPGDIHQYSLGNLPQTIGAVRSDTPDGPYRVVLGVHNLQQSYGLLIDDVSLVVTSVPPLLHAVNVMRSTSPVIYNSDIYRATYNDEVPGARISTTSLTHPSTSLQLAPGESDEIDLQIVNPQPHLIADLHFQVQVTYHALNSDQQHTVLLKHTFEVFFLDATNWHPYHLTESGVIVAGS